MSHKSFSQGSPSMPLTIMEAENSLGTSSGQVNNLESSINQWSFAFTGQRYMVSQKSDISRVVNYKVSGHPKTINGFS